MNDHKNTDPDTDERQAGGRMGKEAKIGIAVIGILLVTFCVALAWRLQGASEGGTHEDTETAAASAADLSPDKTHSGKTTHSVAKPAEATVVAAKATVGEAPKDAAVPVAQWNLATDAAPAKPSAAGGSPEPPLNYMPMPPAPEPVQVRDPYAGQAPKIVEPSPPSWQELPPRAPDPVASGGAYAPAPHTGPAMPPPNNPTQQEPSGLRLIEPPPVDMGRRSTHPPAEATSRQFLPPASGPTARPVPALPVAQSRLDASLSPVGENLRDEDGRYTVQPNDSYWTISEKLYGTGAYFKALVEHNRQRSVGPNQLAVGDAISAPGRDELEEIYPGLCPKPEHREVQKNHLSTVSSQRPYGGGRTYVVQENDTLFDIARWELGKASRWFEIYQLNRDLIGSDYNYLPPGAELVLPEGGQTDRVTRQPESGSPLRR